MAFSQLLSRSEWQIGEEAEILPSAVPIQPGTELAITCDTGSQRGGSVPRGLTRPPAWLLLLRGSRGQPGVPATKPGSWRVSAGSKPPNSLPARRRWAPFPAAKNKSRCNLTIPVVLKHFLNRRLHYFDDGITFSKAGVEAIGIIMGKKKGCFWGSLLPHVFSSLWDSWNILGKLLQKCDCTWGLSEDLLGAATALVNLVQNGWVWAEGRAQYLQWFWFLFES